MIHTLSPNKLLGATPDGAPPNLTMSDDKPSPNPGSHSLRKDRVRLIYLLRRRKDITHEEFADYWLNVHSKVFIGSRVAHQYIYTLRYDQVSWGEN